MLTVPLLDELPLRPELQTIQEETQNPLLYSFSLYIGVLVVCIILLIIAVKNPSNEMTVINILCNAICILLLMVMLRQYYILPKKRSTSPVPITRIQSSFSSIPEKRAKQVSGINLRLDYARRMREGSREYKPGMIYVIIVVMTILHMLSCFQHLIG